MQFGKAYAVDDVETVLIKTNPPALQVTAVGRTVSSGWSDPQLSRYFYLTPPEDGVQDFDLIAREPEVGCPILPVLTPIRAARGLRDVDIANFWGPGLPLRGVRVIAVANEKTALFDDPFRMHAMVTAEGVAAGASRPPPAAVVLGFEADIKPLFRRRDVTVMAGIAGWRLDNYEDVKRNAALILERLKDESMPCDGAWPAEDIERFASWQAAGMAP